MSETASQLVEIDGHCTLRHGALLLEHLQLLSPAVEAALHLRCFFIRNMGGGLRVVGGLPAGLLSRPDITLTNFNPSSLEIRKLKAEPKQP
jgi:hypothetical protein